MQITVHKSEVKGRVRAPSSKSYTIRGLMCAALSEGESTLIGPLEADDTTAALEVLQAIGVEADRRDPAEWAIRGGKFRAPDADLFCRDSAATLRFMMAICALIPAKCRLTAGESLAKRPQKELIDALEQWGVNLSSMGGHPPVVVKGGKLPGGETALRGDISSQYVSALLLIAPRAEKESRIHLTTPLESKPYAAMTVQCLKTFGIKLACGGDLEDFQLSPQKYTPARYKVEGDWSSASYLLALGAAAGDIQVSNLPAESLQGDKALVEFLKEMGARVEVKSDSVGVKKQRLKAIKADLNNCIDLLPTMAALAALAEGTSQFSGIKRARLKESNRIGALREGLERLSIEVGEEEDRLTIKGGRPIEGVIEAGNDHRIAMAFSIMGAAAGPVTIRGAECVSKTFPDYWVRLAELGVRTDEQ